MNDPSDSTSSPRLDRSALERVLARAAELQAETGEPTDDFTEAQLLELGKEVGLSQQSLRQALAEERTRSPIPARDGGLSATIFGAGRVAASRTVPGKPGSVLETINAWMERQELLRIKRRLGDRIVWEPRRGFSVSIKRGLNVSGRDYALASSFEVSATVVAVDDAQVIVSLDADLKSYRQKVAGISFGATMLGALSAGSLAIIGFPAIIAVTPVLALTGTGIFAGRAFQSRMMTRSQLALEQILDRLERGELDLPPNLLGALAIAATVRPPRGM